MDPSENELHRPYPVRSCVGKSLTWSPFFPPSSLVLFFCFVVVWPLVIITELWRCNETPTECFRWPWNARNEHVSKMLYYPIFRLQKPHWFVRQFELFSSGRCKSGVSISYSVCFIFQNIFSMVFFLPLYLSFLFHFQMP